VQGTPVTPLTSGIQTGTQQTYSSAVKQGGELAAGLTAVPSRLAAATGMMIVGVEHS
jgi:hypothetical protein